MKEIGRMIWAAVKWTWENYLKPLLKQQMTQRLQRVSDADWKLGAFFTPEERAQFASLQASLPKKIEQNGSTS